MIPGGLAVHLVNEERRLVEIGFSDDELVAIEREHPEGMSSEAIVGLLLRRGIKITEATLRKWVQLGLLPRSRRVGFPGGHPGSVGLYPASVVRRIQRLRMMMETHTIEQIKDHGLFVPGDVEELEACLERIFGQLGRLDRAEGHAEIGEARRLATELVAKLVGLETRRTMRAV